MNIDFNYRRWTREVHR